MSKIEVQNLYKVFGRNPERAIPMLEQGKAKDEILKKTKLSVGVNNVSFSVNEGEILVIMGLSGSGKSTLIRCVNRLIEPTDGVINIDGVDVMGLSHDDLLAFRRKKFGMVFQNFALFPHRTVLENVEFGLEIQGKDAAFMRKKATESLNLVGLEGWGDYYPKNLSGGMQQRVGLARALAVDPDILIMDEAFSALDPLIRQDMQDELIALQDRVQKTILFITHDLDEALKLGDRIILLKDGKLVQEGTAEDILTNPATPYVEKFVENVDMSKVLTAKSVMNPPRVVAYRTDGPRVALHKMREAGISSLFVLGKGHILRGMVTAEDAADAIKNGAKDLESILNTDIKTVELDTPVLDFMQELAALPIPIAVVKEDGKLAGVIVRGSLLAGLTEKGQAETND
ncbi:quaternary amine ABC transporter ATP-binding protein [Desulfovibrio inopinatus]|uniref:quaternary amine ABC transporter ATP-binding protein n=1 Tax=Desulfovibrio inopinatus TaxID=102109 RepID=UPI000426A826|nr:glycine betaine/L-proline ABC transporter ATP-binding protein [Desulfovibrio inopinatus]